MNGYGWPLIPQDGGGDIDSADYVLERSVCIDDRGFDYSSPLMFLEAGDIDLTAGNLEEGLMRCPKG